MAILNKHPLTLAEVSIYIKDLDDKKQIVDYLKKFTKLKADKAKKLREEIKALENPKIKEGHIVKLVDILPEDQEDLNKIFTESSLSQEEAVAVLNIVKGAV